MGKRVPGSVQPAVRHIHDGGGPSGGVIYKNGRNIPEAMNLSPDGKTILIPLLADCFI
jgi:hypothetical protein